MTTLREDIVHHSPKVVSNLALVLVFWIVCYIVQVTLNPVIAGLVFYLQTELLIVSGIFLVRALFNTLTIVDHLTKSFLKRIGITEGWSRERILKDTICIVAVLLVAAALYPLFNLLSNFEQMLQQITTYFTLGLILLFVYDIGRTLYRITEKKANSIANRVSNLINEDEKTNGKNICTIDQLKGFIDLSPEEEKKLKQITQRHPMRITPYYMSLIDWDDPNDPIKKMAIPSLDEFNLQGSYDTSGEAENTKMVGLQYKYQETALILATNQCAMYCRHCFRKRLVGLQTKEIIERFEDAATYIKQHKQINNVLVSGGDPLILKNEVIEKFLSILSAIPQINFIRFGSRVPVTFPSRFKDENLLRILSAYSRPNRRIYVVTQFNHPKEITKQSIEAVDNLIKSGVIVNNQTVLLKGVNDNPVTIANLLNRLVSIGVNPYYIFQCRPVKRVKHHFQVPLLKGIEIIETAKKHCNGHSKRFKYIMSHRTGKIEILGRFENEIYFKYHQAKNRNKLGKIFKRPVDESAGWLEDFKSTPIRVINTPNFYPQLTR